MSVINDLRPSMWCRLNNKIYEVIEYEHVKPGKGGAFVRLKLKEFPKEKIISGTYRPDMKVDIIVVKEKAAYFMYKSQTTYFFMDKETFEEISVEEDLISEKVESYLKAGMEIFLLMVEKDNSVVGVKLPNIVELKVIDTGSDFEGDTVTRSTKVATLETGKVIRVPVFIEINDIIKVDTRDDKYIGKL